MNSQGYSALPHSFVFWGSLQARPSPTIRSSFTLAFILKLGSLSPQLPLFRSKIHMTDHRNVTDHRNETLVANSLSSRIIPRRKLKDEIISSIIRLWGMKARVTGILNERSRMGKWRGRIADRSILSSSTYNMTSEVAHKARISCGISALVFGAEVYWDYCFAIGHRLRLNQYILYVFGQTRQPLAVSRAKFCPGSRPEVSSTPSI